MKKINSQLVLICFFVLLNSCGNDGIYNEETNREAVKKRKERKDSIKKAERAKDTLSSRSVVSRQPGVSNC